MVLCMFDCPGWIKFWPGFFMQGTKIFLRDYQVVRKFFGPGVWWEV